MELPIEVKLLCEQIALNFPQDKLKSAANILSTVYRERERNGKTFINDDLAAAAYLLSRMPATLGAVSSALKQTLLRYKGEIKTVLDIGAGTGAVEIALSQYEGIKEVHCIERQAEMLNIGKSVTERLNINAEWSLGDANKLSSQAYDLVVSSYMLNEIEDNKLRSVIEGMWQCTKGLLLIVDNGTVKGYETLKKATEILKELDGYVVAPCPNVLKCPLSADDWCHFTARISRSKIHKALKGGDVPYEDEKFCYVAVSRTPQTVCESRVLRHPKIASGRVGLKLCTKDGVQEKQVTKKDKELFKKARKCSAGDEF